jgi:hypothetical protein
VLLEKQITRGTIEKFIELCKDQDKDERFILLLTALCSCMEEAIVSNQNDIIEILLENEVNRQSLVLPIRMKKKRIQVGIEVDEGVNWVPIKDFMNYSDNNDGLTLYKYYVAFIDLCAEMALQRNHRALNHLADIYTLEIVFKAITHKYLESNIKSKFAKLFLNIYVDKEPFDFMKIPNFTRIWDEISLSNNRIQYYTSHIPEYIYNTKKFIVEYFQEINGIQSIFNNDK